MSATGETPEEKLLRLRAMVDPKQRTWDLSPHDVSAIKWALVRIASLEQRVKEVGWQRDEHREATVDLKTIRDGTLARWERSLQEVIDAAERAKRKVSQERAEVAS